MKRLLAMTVLLGACDVREPPPTVAPYGHPRDVERYDARELEVARGWSRDAEEYEPWMDRSPAAQPWTENECPDSMLGGLITGVIEAATGSNPSPACPNC